MNQSGEICRICRALAVATNGLCAQCLAIFSSASDQKQNPEEDR